MGKKHTKEAKEKIGKASTGSGNGMFGIRGDKNSLYKTKWYNNGIINKRFKPDKWQPGWELGRLNFKGRYLGKGNPAFGKKWIFNPKTKERKYIKENELNFYLDNGFILKYVRLQ